MKGRLQTKIWYSNLPVTLLVKMLLSNAIIFEIKHEKANKEQICPTLGAERARSEKCVRMLESIKLSLVYQNTTTMVER